MDDMGGEMATMGTTSDDCYATNVPWLQTMAYCIHEMCDADGYSFKNQVKCFSAQAVAGASEPTFQNSLPAIAPTVELSEDAIWLNVTSLVNHDIYFSSYGSEKEFARSEYIHTRYSYVLLRYYPYSILLSFQFMRLTNRLQCDSLSHSHRHLH